MTGLPVQVTLGLLSQIPPGEGRNFEVAGEKIAIFHTRAGEVFATQAKCPHRQGPLADGLVGARTLICPLHAWKFDLTTGEPLMGNCKIKTFSVKIDEHGSIIVNVDNPNISRPE